MDAMLGRPISEIVSEIALPEAVRAALLGTANTQRAVLDLVKAYEEGNWGDVHRLVTRLQQDEHHLSDSYLDAVDWAQKVFQV